MKKATCRISAALAALLLSQMPQQAGANPCELTIGVSLHPYYSWVKNIVGDAAEVTTLVPPDVDPHTYQPTPADMVRLEGLDAVVVNGVGHDEFITPMLKAIDNPMLHVLDTSKGLPLIPSFNDRHYAFEEQEGGGAAKVSYNSHTYIAITGAIQQMQMLNRELGKFCPDHAAEFTEHLREYAAKLRNMLQETLSRIQGLKMENLRIATVHDGYSYLFQELGIEVSAVVQPRHGVTPSSKQLQDTIKRIKQAKVNVLFGEMDYEKKYVDIIFQETGCRLYALSHISNGEYSKEHFEQTMKKNMDIIVQALTEAAGRSVRAAAAPVSVQDVMSQQMQDTAKQMQEKMRQEMQNKMQQAVPEIQQQQMQNSMGQQAQQVQGAMQQNVQQTVPAVQQQMQDAAKQMQEKMQQQMQNAVPAIQQEQMSKAMGQQAQQVQGAMQQNVQQAVPAVQQQQMQDAAKQMQEKMQQQMQQAVPAIQQEQMSKAMGQQAQQVQGAMQQNVQQAVPAVQQQMQDAAKQMQEKMQQAVPEIQQKQMSEQMQKAVQQVQDSLKQNPPPAAPPQAKP